MKRKLIIYNGIVTAIALILMFGLGIIVTRNNNFEVAQQNIIAMTEVYSNNYSDAADFTREVDENIRVTVIDAAGKVLADSKYADVSGLENHIGREEIQAALKGEPKTAVRNSETAGVKMIYYALKKDTADGYVFVRVSMPVGSINMYVLKTIPLSLVILLASLTFSVIVCALFSDKSLKPYRTVKESLEALNRGSYIPVLATSDDDEINKMLLEINEVSAKLKDNMAHAAEEKTKLDYILNNISDGIIVIDSGFNVGLMNSNAQAIFGVTAVTGKNANCLTSDRAFIDNLTECVEKGQGAIFDYQSEKAYYLCTARITENGLLILVMSDITAAKNNEKLRSEFFANASHELKTPLTSIKGFNDLLMLQNKNKKLAPYIEKTGGEADRMLALIDDMLKLSDLENGGSPELSDVSVSEVAEEVVENLKPLADEKRVTLTASSKGGSVIKAERKHIYELIKNLAENAVKYNNAEGKAEIDVSADKNSVTVTVSDNGIGINDKHQQRIFERFYRVEKSRSRETGGTGLGLAIVKHAADIYRAEVTLKSKYGEGTSVTVKFKK